MLMDKKSVYILSVTLDFRNQDKIPDIRRFISPVVDALEYDKKHIKINMIDVLVCP
jgi:type III secretory pathway lipoprotein EscJ